MRIKTALRVLIAFAIVPAAIGLTPSTAQSATFTFPYFGNPQNDCTNEVMLYEGNAHLVIETSTNPDGSTHAIFHMNTQGVEATGFPSGDNYVVTDVTNTQQEADISQQPTQTHTTHHLIVQHMPNDLPNDDLHEHVNVTVTWVDGTPTPFFQRDSAECK
jgi:hypothetical protein